RIQETEYRGQRREDSRQPIAVSQKVRDQRTEGRDQRAEGRGQRVGGLAKHLNIQTSNLLILTSGF
ncbi:MAG TPA: hypothetical protein PK661_04200, partial [Syntrophorhabdaceae bacterium]|nr:hypothetical protein [Syntrophorhabdaceae bacterium]